jgi:DNA mismatch endonuclease, patch repair protein
MQANRRSDTGPECQLRSELHSRGCRFRKDFRVDLSDLRVRVDVAFPRARVAVFMDGCFWHRCPLHSTDPKRNSEFWMRKLQGNVDRDRRVDAALIAAGWTVVRCWEHEAAHEAADRVETALHKETSETGPPCL